MSTKSLRSLKTRAFTKQEVRERLVSHFIGLAYYWSKVQPSGPHDDTEHARMKGLIHSILSTLDGGSIALPAFNISAVPHPDDKAFCQRSGDNWYKANEVINDDVQLHDLMTKLEKKLEKTV